MESTPAALAEHLRILVNNFTANRMASGNAIRKLGETDPGGFREAAIDILREVPEHLGAKFVLAMLLAQPVGLKLICNPAIFSLDESVALVLHAKSLDPLIEVKLGRLLTNNDLSSAESDALAARVMDVVERSSTPELSLPALRQLILSPNGHIRSKAALLIGRVIQNPQWAKLVDPLQDPRVVANAVESLWGLKSDAARAAFEEAAQSAQNRIAGNAAVGLYLAGDFVSVNAMFRMSHSDSSAARRTGAWCMGRTGDPRFLSNLFQRAGDPDKAVRTMAEQAVGMIEERIRVLVNRGTISLQIRIAKWHAGLHELQVLVDGGAEERRGLTRFQFVILNGIQAVEDEFVLTELTHPSPAHYQLTWRGEMDPSHQVSVQLYTENGCGWDTAHELIF